MRAPAAQLTIGASRTAGAAHLLRCALRAFLQLLWFALIPLLFSGIIWRYFVPHSVSALGFEGRFGAVARDHGLLLTLLVFLSLACTLRYWRNWLPGGRYLSSLPDELVARVPRRRIATCESACALLGALEQRSANKQLPDYTNEQKEVVQAARDELRSLLSMGKWSKVALACEKLEALARPIARASSIKGSLIFCALLAAAAGLALQMRVSYLQAYDVMGTSMLPTLTPGEVLAGGVVGYGAGKLPRRGDVVVLHTRVDGRALEVIKRVIGLPGDHITMNGAHPIINGWPVPLCEAGAYYDPNDETAKTGDPSGLLVMEFLEGEAYLTLQAAVAAPMPEYVVKADEIFVLGDNRSSSRDSRAFDRGMPRGFALEDVKARVARVLFRPTPRGDIDLGAALEPLAPSALLDGADTSGIQIRIAGCLAVRPKTASPPRPPTSALARHD